MSSQPQLNTIAATIFWRETFQEGQIICHKNNWDMGMYLFFKATNEDVERYSGKNGLYAVIIYH